MWWFQQVIELHSKKSMTFLFSFELFKKKIKGNICTLPSYMLRKNIPPIFFLSCVITGMLKSARKLEILKSKVHLLESLYRRFAVLTREVSQLCLLLQALEYMKSEAKIYILALCKQLCSRTNSPHLTLDHKSKYFLNRNPSCPRSPQDNTLALYNTLSLLGEICWQVMHFWAVQVTL